MFFSTFSIVAHDAATGSYGIAVASKFLAVGAYVPYCRIGVGAVATQAHVNMAYGPDGLALMAQGLTADECVQRLIANDTGRDERQFGVVDAQGNAATYTGTKCIDWAGGQVGKGYAVQGNILAGANVISAMALAYENTSGEFANRLFAALKAADEAGGTGGDGNRRRCWCYAPRPVMAAITIVISIYGSMTIVTQWPRWGGCWHCTSSILALHLHQTNCPSTAFYCVSYNRSCNANIIITAPFTGNMMPSPAPRGGPLLAPKTSKHGLISMRQRLTHRHWLIFASGFRCNRLVTCHIILQLDVL